MLLSAKSVDPNEIEVEIDEMPQMEMVVIKPPNANLKISNDQSGFEDVNEQRIRQYHNKVLSAVSESAKKKMVEQN